TSHRLCRLSHGTNFRSPEHLCHCPFGRDSSCIHKVGGSKPPGTGGQRTLSSQILMLRVVNKSVVRLTLLLRRCPIGPRGQTQVLVGAYLRGCEPHSS